MTCAEEPFLFQFTLQWWQAIMQLKLWYCHHRASQMTRRSSILGQKKTFTHQLPRSLSSYRWTVTFFLESSDFLLTSRATHTIADRGFLLNTREAFYWLRSYPESLWDFADSHTSCLWWGICKSTTPGTEKVLNFLHLQTIWRGVVIFSSLLSTSNLLSFLHDMQIRL